MTKSDVITIYKAELTRVGNPLDAWRGTRTRVQAELQIEKTIDLWQSHAVQTTHFAKLWEAADALVLAAGITSEGCVS